MNEVLSNILVHLFYYVGVVFLVGFLVSLINRWFYALVGETRIVCYATGFLGTPIHELSHALMCLVFFHRINDIKFLWFDCRFGISEPKYLPRCRDARNYGYCGIRVYEGSELQETSRNGVWYCNKPLIPSIPACELRLERQDSRTEDQVRDFVQLSG